MIEVLDYSEVSLYYNYNTELYTHSVYMFNIVTLYVHSVYHTVHL